MTEPSAEMLPPSVNALLGQLSSDGFRIIRREYDEARFGDIVIVSAQGRISIQIVRDKGQWSVQASPSPNEWFSAETWVGYLGLDSGDVSSSIDTQCRIIGDHLEAITSVMDRDRDAIRHLLEVQRRQARQHGIPFV